jgi:hypothetical protein
MFKSSRFKSSQFKVDAQINIQRLSPGDKRRALKQPEKTNFLAEPGMTHQRAYGFYDIANA